MENMNDENQKKDIGEKEGFIKSMVSNPFEKIKKVANGEINIVKNTIIIMIIYILTSVACKIVSLMKNGIYSELTYNIMEIITSILNPIILIIVPSVIVLLLNKKNKKKFITILSTIVITNIPLLLINVIDIIEILISAISIISNPISTTLSVIAIILTYFGIKEIFGIKENSQFIKKYAIIELISNFVINFGTSLIFSFIFIVLTRIG